MENSLAAPQKTKHRIPIGSSISTSGYKRKIIESWVLKRYWFIHVHGSIPHHSQGRKAAQASVAGRADKHDVVHYPASERKETLTRATTCMDLEDIMLSNISRSQANKCCMSPSLKVPRGVRFTDSEGRGWAWPGGAVGLVGASSRTPKGCV